MDKRILQKTWTGNKHGQNIRYGKGLPRQTTVRRHILEEKDEPVNKENTLKRIKTSTSIRYLGCRINADLTWGKQIGHMNSCVMQLVSHLQDNRVTLLQGCMILKEVLGPQLEIGFRHAYVPEKRVKKWDKWITRAILRRADMRNAKIHQSAIATIIKGVTLEDKNIIDKTIQITENILKRSSMKTYYRHELKVAEDEMELLGKEHQKGKIEDKITEIMNQKQGKTN